MFLISFVNGLFRILEVAIIIDCFLSWLPDLKYSKFGEIIHNITNPILEPCRRLLRRFELDNLPFDFSPIVAFILMDIIRSILVWIVIMI